MNVKTVDDPNGASASSAVATPSSTMAPTPMKPPIGIGTGSVIQRTTTPTSTAARVCCLSSMPSGRSSITMVASGASTRPTVRRPFSNRSSLLGELLLAEAAIGRRPHGMPGRRRSSGRRVLRAGHGGLRDVECGPDHVPDPGSRHAPAPVSARSPDRIRARPRHRGCRSRPAGRRTWPRRSRSATTARRARAGSATGCCRGTARRGRRSRGGRGRRSG